MAKTFVEKLMAWRALIGGGLAVGITGLLGVFLILTGDSTERHSMGYMLLNLSFTGAMGWGIASGHKREHERDRHDWRNERGRGRFDREPEPVDLEPLDYPTT